MRPQIVPPDFKNEWRQISDAEYHGDRTAVSSSGVRHALRSARAFEAFHIRGAETVEETPAIRLGSAAHLMLLEHEAFKRRFIEIPDFGDMRSSKNRALRDDWMADLPKDAVALPGEEREKLVRMTEALLAHTTARNLLKGGAMEQCGYFRDPGTGLKCRIKPDCTQPDLSVLVDLKTARDASFNGFQRAVGDRGLHVQMAWYARGIQAIHGRPPDSCAFIVVENQEPFDVCVWLVPGALLELAERGIEKGLERIKQGVLTDKWPGLQSDGQAALIDLKSWAYEKELFE